MSLRSGGYLRVFVFVSVLCLTGVAAFAADPKAFTPLPNVIKIDSPDPAVPERMAKLSGIWHGQWQWDGQRQWTTIVVERITPNEAFCIYSWGPSGDRGGWMRRRGMIAGGKIIMKTSHDTIELEPKNDTETLARFARGTFSAKATLSKEGPQFLSEYAAGFKPESVSLSPPGEWKFWTRLPEDIKVTPPESDVPPEIAQFSGIWQGNYSDTDRVTIVVEKLSATETVVVHSASPKSGSGDWKRVNATIVENQLVLKYGEPQRVVVLRVTEPKHMTAEFTHTGEGWSVQGSLEKR